MKKELYYKYFEEKILPSMYVFEDYRLKIVRKVILTSIFMFLLGIFCAFLFIYLSIKHNIAIILLPIFLFLMYVFFIKSIINVICTGKDYQKWLVDKILPYFFEPVANFKFWPKNHDIASILNSNLFPNFDTQEDLETIFGIYNNTNIIISDSRLKLPVKGAQRPDLFKGTIIQLELPKAINNHVILLSKNLRKVNKYKQINPNIQELNRYLYAFAKNSKNLEFLNKDFWQIIKRFGELYTAKTFSLSYDKDVMIIALAQKRPWQFGFLFKSLLKAKNYDDLIERFIVIFELVDYLCNSVE